ncbi:hypothetical protein H6503_06570 [Candidatus Woesearchaeota archaeon]|nr:hypothetical protein [Candidatus Woesearchaeota archaeon]
MNLDRILNSIIPRDQEYIIVPHMLETGENVQRHMHPKANEWVVYDQGEFTFTIDGVTKTYKGNGRFTKIHIAPGQLHSMECLSPMSYFVVRDCIDEIIYQ